jgi:hypothetical protein
MNYAIAELCVANNSPPSNPSFQYWGEPSFLAKAQEGPELTDQAAHSTF